VRLVVLIAAALAVMLAAPAPAAAHHRDRDEVPWGAEEPPPEEAAAGEEPAPPPPAPSPPAAERPRWPVAPERVRGRTVRGKVARLRVNGKAALPRRAPRRVKAMLAAGNRIVGKPYKWGGGHARLHDTGYDCSGTVSFALIKAGLLRGSMVSGSFARWGVKGPGRWVTVYANPSHVYMEVAGLRLDTSAMGDPGGSGPRWRAVIGKRQGFRTRHPAGL
jgi:hypothetical protein